MGFFAEMYERAKYFESLPLQRAIARRATGSSIRITPWKLPKREDEMDFCYALNALRENQKVARSGWNGKGMWLGLRHGFDIEKEAEKAHDNWMESKKKDGITSRLSEWGEEFMQPYVLLSERAKDIDRGMFRGSEEMTLPYIYIEYPVGHPAYPEGSRVPWLASQTDLLAEDWTIV